MTKLNMENVHKIEDKIVKDIEHLISNYLQDRESNELSCTEEEIAMACQLARQKHRNRVTISYLKKSYVSKFTYYIKNITLQ